MSSRELIPSYKTCNLGYAVLTSETTQDHQWAIGQFFSTLPPCPSHVFFSDGDIAVRSAVSEHDVWHGQCLKHINENLKKNLVPMLGPLMQPFLNAFWLVYYAVSPTTFASREYLEYNLGLMKTQWAWCYVATHFTCGVRTTGRVKSENAVNKLLGGVKTSLYELVVNLLKRDKEQAKQEQLAIRKVGTDSSQATFIANLRFQSSCRQYPTEVDSLFNLHLDQIREDTVAFSVQQSRKAQCFTMSTPRCFQLI
jgi:hypothetical protein